MADIENLGISEDQSESADEAPDADDTATWQRFLRKWQAPIAFGPFSIFIFIMLEFFANSKAGWLFMTLIFATVLWAVAVVGYSLYLKYLD